MNRDPFAAIADPTRREILGLLSNDDLNINQISEHFSGITRQAVSKQLKHLQDSGLISIEKNGREKYCYLTPESLKEVDNWLKQYEKFWNKKLDRLGNYLKKEGGK